MAVDEKYIARSSMLGRVSGDLKMMWMDRFETERIEMDEVDGDERRPQGCRQYRGPSLQLFPN